MWIQQPRIERTEPVPLITPYIAFSEERFFKLLYQIKEHMRWWRERWEYRNILSTTIQELLDTLPLTEIQYIIWLDALRSGYTTLVNKDNTLLFRSIDTIETKILVEKEYIKIKVNQYLKKHYRTPYIWPHPQTVSDIIQPIATYLYNQKQQLQQALEAQNKKDVWIATDLQKTLWISQKQLDLFEEL